MPGHIVARLAMASLGLVLTLVPGTAAAAAKGGMEISAAPSHAARVGEPVRISGSGDEEAARYLRACLQERETGRPGWRTLACGATVGAGAGARVETRVWPRRRGVFQVRGVLYGLNRPGAARPEPLRASPVVTVRVR
ncbi:hypothetical protein [Streptomyces orinoci]|uniref:Secreted protein n=1 Tax=Streptomyces orinoci TaxID=67339 RepID=A0ABV3JR58_STRON|nr:hypothetical protein [Streptomyces orinoci]